MLACLKYQTLSSSSPSSSPSAKIILQNTAQKIKFSIKDFSSKWDQILSFLRVWSHLLKKSLMENFKFCAVKITKNLD